MIGLSFPSPSSPSLPPSSPSLSNRFLRKKNEITTHITEHKSSHEKTIMKTENEHTTPWDEMRWDGEVEVGDEETKMGNGMGIKDQLYFFSLFLPPMLPPPFSFLSFPFFFPPPHPPLPLSQKVVCVHDKERKIWLEIFKTQDSRARWPFSLFFFFFFGFLGGKRGKEKKRGWKGVKGRGGRG